MLPLRPFAALFIASLALAACQPANDSDIAPTLDPAQGVATDPITATPMVYTPAAEVISVGNAARIQRLGTLASPDAVQSGFVTYAMAPDGTRLAALDINNLVVWDLLDGSVAFTAPRDGAIEVFFSPGKDEIYTLADDGRVAVYTVAGTRQTTMNALNETPVAWSWAEDAGLLALSGEGGAVKIWDLRQRVSLVTIETDTQPAYNVALSPDGETLLTAGESGRIDVWDWRSGERRGDLGTYNTPLLVMATPDGAEAAVVTTGGITLWSMETLEPRGAIPLATPESRGGVRFAPDGSLLLLASDGGPLEVWDTATLRQTAILPEVSGYELTVAFSPRSDLLLTGVGNEAPVLWNVADLRNGQLARMSLPGSVPEPQGIAWSTDQFSIFVFDVLGDVAVLGVPPQEAP
jgi:WD40 repeat protein